MTAVRQTIARVLRAIGLPSLAALVEKGPIGGGGGPVEPL